ncbi:MAG TPA: carbon-phosphorus lyase complex subunit PhnI [Opitutaceae bacterium]
MFAAPPTAAVSAAQHAIAEADRLAGFHRLRARTTPLELAQLRAQFRALLSKLIGEAGLYAPEHAALALKQTEGEIHEAVIVLRAFRQTLTRRYTSGVVDTRGMFVQRRISSAFREIPGGQILGPTLDYSQRLLEVALASETPDTIDAFLTDFSGRLERSHLRDVRTFGKVTDLLRNEGLLRPATDHEDQRVQDITREPIQFPAPRSARLQALARAETGAIMALAYSGMRGQGGDHPTIGEVRVGRVAVRVTDARGRSRYLGSLQVTEAENISKIKVKKKDPVPYLSLGYGLCFGQNETKAICMGMLDRSMRIGGDAAPAISQEFVMYHTEGADAWGALHSLKLPAHVDFAAELSLLRAAVARRPKASSSSTPRTDETPRTTNTTSDLPEQEINP